MEASNTESLIDKQLGALDSGVHVGEGASKYKIRSVSSEQIITERVANSTQRIIPTIVVKKILEGINKKIITLDQVLRKNLKDKESIFDLISFNHDKFIMGYDSTIYKICEYCLDSKNQSANNDKKLSSHGDQEYFDTTEFIKSIVDSKLSLPKNLPYQFISSLLTKPFVILTGLSGSGKTKLAEAFSIWITENKNQYCMVSVGADWTNREPLLGFPNALEQKSYIKPDCGSLDLILRASADPNRPYFLILDEMNMSHVERYFADFLSAMESTDSDIALHSGIVDWNTDEDLPVPPLIKLPKNLFIIGTVNIDETTYMFSPKVLDRANVIEFRVSEEQMKDFFSDPAVLNMESLRGKGSSMGVDFVKKAASSTVPASNLKESLMPFFTNLQEAGAEFGYRTASEISRFVTVCKDIAGDSMDENTIVDAAIMQKLLPKVHGSRNKIEKILKDLAKLCLVSTDKEPFQKDEKPEDIKYPLSYEKLQRMHKRVISDGFTSYAEA